MPKITFMGAGSSVFAKSVLGDSMCAEPLQRSTIALYDIDKRRLADSARMLRTMNRTLGARMKIESHLGVSRRRAALRGADYVVNAVQVGGYEPSTVIDFEIPKKYGLRQTIGDTLGIGGIFRTLRTLPVVVDFCRDIEKVCPGATFINYANPMAMLMMGVLRATSVRGVGLCHSVEGLRRPCLLHHVGLKPKKLQWKVAGINHQGWLLEITDDGKDLYPEIKRRYRKMKRQGLLPEWDRVRLEVMDRFGHYVTESSEHTSEYVPWFIKARYPELIEQYHVPLDEYPRRCVGQIEGWKRMRRHLVESKTLEHRRSGEYASYIMQAMETNEPFTFGGNVMNTGLIPNLPAKACVEVLCVADRRGITPTFVGDLPEQCAALNRTNINVQILTVEAVLAGRKDAVYQAALLDPHTGGELSIDDTIALCKDLFKAHGKMIPKMT